MKRVVFIIIAVFFFQPISFAQTEPIKLLGSHSITIECGTKTNSTISTSTSLSGIDVKAGFIGSLCYGYCFDEEWAFTLSGGVFGAGVNTTFNNVETNAVLTFLTGIKYYPTELSLGSKGRVYVGLSLGQYTVFATRSIRTESINGPLTETINESVFGGQASVGIDFFIAAWFKIGPKLSYHFMGDFEQAIGTKKNLSGTAFSLEIGSVF